VRRVCVREEEWEREGGKGGREREKMRERNRNQCEETVIRSDGMQERYAPFTLALALAGASLWAVDSDSRPSTDCMDASSVSCCTPAVTSSFVIELNGTV
jgi:hypothetical protein